jgi:LysM repeat protein
MRRTGRSILITLAFCLLTFLPVQAQENMLQNPGFETDYSGRMGRGDFNFPTGWHGWYTDSPHTEHWMNVPPTGYPHNGPFRRSGTNAQSIAKGGGSFTAAAIQRVPNIPAGAVVRGSAWVYLENNEGTNAQVRIGIGSNVVTDVYGDITWSDWEKRLNGQHQISIEHVATGGEVSIFIYATQTWANDPNALYIDDASLTIVGMQDVPTEEDGEVVVVEPPRPNGVPFVAPQNSGEGGAITHIVGSGDTVASIAVAYGVSIDDILALNGLDKTTFLQLDQQLIITPSSDSTQTESDSQSTEDTSEAVVSPVETEEAAEVAEIAEVAEVTETSQVQNSLFLGSQDGTISPTFLVTQHSSSVNIGDSLNGIYSLTFADNQVRIVQVMPEFTGGDLPLDFWVYFWDTNPDLVIPDVMLVVENFTIKLSLSALNSDATDGSITYTATIDSVKDFQGEEVGMTALSQTTLKSPDIYFQPDEAFLNAISEVLELASTRSAG